MQFAPTPHILGGEPNLISLKHDLPKTLERDTIKVYVRTCNKIAHDAWILVEEPEFNRLGSTVLAIKLASFLPAFVLTLDLPLHLHLAKAGLNPVNFNHIRQGSLTSLSRCLRSRQGRQERWSQNEVDNHDRS
jgi:hypothetical protein